MTTQEISGQFRTTSSAWKQALTGYSNAQLIAQPDADSWSIGQVYLHILGSALRFHGKQVEVCLQSEENSAGETNPFALEMLAKGEMPPDPIKVPPSPQYTPPQPESHAQIEAMFTEVEAMMERLAASIDEAAKAGKGTGKTPHPRFGFLGAKDWYHILAMHFKHHQHQKARIDAYLTANGIA